MAQRSEAVAAAALVRVGQFTSAERLLAPIVGVLNDASAWLVLGIARRALGKDEEARIAFDEALARDPANSEIHFQLGLMADRQGDYRQAKERYAAALACAPAHAPARHNLAVMHLELGDPQAALRELERLRHDGADSAELHNARTRALFAIFDDAGALAAARRARELHPAGLRSRVDMVVALSGLGRLAEAEAELASLRGDAGARFEALVGGGAAGLRFRPRTLWVARMFQQQAVCDWRQRGALVAALREALERAIEPEAFAEPGVLLQALGLPLGPQELRRLGGIALSGARAEGARLAASLPPVAMPPRRARMRIGFLAASLREHPEAYLLRRVCLDRDAERFEYFVYALNPSDGSALRREIEDAVDRFVDVSTSSAREAIARLRADEVDLLVDLTGANVHARPEVVAARVSPVQVGFLATPTTLGEGIHDYRITDAHTTPPAAAPDWHESLVLVPPPLATYDDSLHGARPGTRADHGLPEGLVLCAMHQLFKIEPDVFGVWMRLLRAAPESVLWLLDDGVCGCENLRREAQMRGVSPERLVFAPRVPLHAHLGRLKHADLFLDSFYCSAHTSALDALWAGVPVLTREGNTMASRMGATYVRAAGLPDLVVGCAAEYEAKAMELATDRRQLDLARAKLAEARASAPAFSTVDRVRALERAFVAMIQRQRDGLPPVTLTIR